MQNEWIPISELVKRSGLSDSTIRRLAGLEKGYPRRISFQRRGTTQRAALRFDWPVVRKQIEKALGRDGVRTEEGETPTPITVLNEVRALKQMVAELASQVRLGKG